MKHDAPQRLFDHEKLDVYRVSLEFVAFVSALVRDLDGIHRIPRDQLIRSSQSIPLNIAESCGKRSPRDRINFLTIARGSAMESAATLDVLSVTGACTPERISQGKTLLVRIVSMLTRMTEAGVSATREDEGGNGFVHEESGSEHEHAYVHEHEEEEKSKGL